MLGFLRRHRETELAPALTFERTTFERTTFDNSPTTLVCGTCGATTEVAGAVVSWQSEENRTGRRVRATIATPFVVSRHRCPVPRAV